MIRSRVRALVCVSAALLMVGACAAAPRVRPVKMGPVETGAGTLTAARKYLEGRWSLVSFEVMPPGGETITFKGDGMLNYDDYGNLDIEIRTDAATGERLSKAGVPNTGGVISSKGRAVVDMQNKTLTYVMEGAPPVGAPSGPLASNRPRYWEVAGDVLTLTTKDADGKPLSVGRWKKMP